MTDEILPSISSDAKPVLGAQQVESRAAQREAALRRAQQERTFQRVSEETIRRAALELSRAVDPRERAIGETLQSALDGGTPERDVFTRMLGDRWPYAHPEDLLNAALPGHVDDWEAWIADLTAKQAEARAQRPNEADADASGLRNGPHGPWILQRDGYFWLNAGGGSYGPHVKSTDLDTAIARQLSTKINLNESSGKALVLGEIKRQYAKVIERARKRYVERRSYYNADTNELICAALQWRDDSEAQFNPAIDGWLHALVGDDKYPLLAAWLAALCELDRPAPLLYLDGGAGIGKSLLTTGIGQLWNCPAVDFEEAIESFNESSARSPFFAADDGFPQKLDFQKLRKMITQDSRRVNEKYTPKYDVDGFARFLVSANNDDVLRYQKTGTLTRNDLEALSDRLLYLRTRLTKAEAEGSFFKGQDKAQWASQGIARHILWLNAQARERGWFTPAHERMVCKPGGAETLLLRLAVGRVPGFLPLIVHYLENPLATESFRPSNSPLMFRTRPPSLYVQVRAVQQALTLQHDKDLLEVCKVLSELDENGEPLRKRRRQPGQSRLENGDWYRVLDAERIAQAWPDGHDERWIKTLSVSTEERLHQPEDDD